PTCRGSTASGWLLVAARVGTCLSSAAWLVGIAPGGDTQDVAVMAGLIACAAASVALVTGLRAIRYRPAALACSGGATLSIAGQAGLTVAGLATAPQASLAAAVVARAALAARCPRRPR